MMNKYIFYRILLILPIVGYIFFFIIFSLKDSKENLIIQEKILNWYFRWNKIYIPWLVFGTVLPLIYLLTISI